MKRPAGCYIVEDYRFRPCPKPQEELRSLVSLHNHSSYSVEDLASLDRVMRLPHMQPLREPVQEAFGLDWVQGLNYADLRYNPPLTPEGVFELETAAIERLGLACAGVAVTDHDSVEGGIELLRKRPLDSGRIALGEELSFRFKGHLFHLGLSGLPAAALEATHQCLIPLAASGHLRELFEAIQATGCLVVLNHPLLPWRAEAAADIPVPALLAEYGWAIHALEFNGMRRLDENACVLELARLQGKPVVGGGDSHMPFASSVLSGSRDAKSFEDFVDEVKAGVAIPFIKRDYFAPLQWKLFLRVMGFIRDYRKIANFRGEPVSQMLQDQLVMLDPAGVAAGLFLRLVALLGLAR